MFQVHSYAALPAARIGTHRLNRVLITCGVVAAAMIGLEPAVTVAQPADPADRARLEARLSELSRQVEELRGQISASRIPDFERSVADVAVFAKAVDWCLRHNEFFKPVYVQQAEQALQAGLERAKALAAGSSPWQNQPGSRVYGYWSRVDGSSQPYALTLPNSFTPDGSNRWPLHVVLHGRAGTMNEVNFISRHEGKPAPDSQDWIQLDVFGRTNNAYRWSGETDVFEAVDDVKRRFRIDDRRVTLHGFSMGGAGAWHLGLHYPDQWSSVGPGAGFVDFYGYQKQTEQLPAYQHATLGIYDAVDYALNAFNVPVCTYGGELDAQLLASTTMVDAAKQLDVPIKLLVGPGMGHKFHPESLKQFMEFHLEASRTGRPSFPGSKHIRFTTRTLKYNKCEWLTIEEMLKPYVPTTVDARINDDGDVEVSTRNVSVLQIARETASQAIIDGDRLPLNSAADGLLPGVYYQKTRDGWVVQSYQESKRFLDNPDLMKRHNLQGPIDDAFMESFICVRGTGEPWSSKQQAWADWTLARFEREFDQWLRGRIRIVDDSDVTEEMIASSHLVLFGDPGSNTLLAKVAKKLPMLHWEAATFQIDGRTFSTDDHGLSMIYPNPLNPRRYIVINSGHTFHEKDFKASNSWLFPRLGDVAVQKFVPDDKGGYVETVEWAEIFNSGWRLPVRRE